VGHQLKILRGSLALLEAFKQNLMSIIEKIKNVTEVNAKE
tara:strand:- start:392 stop:511 length:120 start_codon:yes stop_codon:yes gene_type:complete